MLSFGTFHVSDSTVVHGIALFALFLIQSLNCFAHLFIYIMQSSSHEIKVIKEYRLNVNEHTVGNKDNLELILKMLVAISCFLFTILNKPSHYTNSNTPCIDQDYLYR